MNEEGFKEKCSKCRSCDTNSKLALMGKPGDYVVFCRGCFSTSREGDTVEKAIEIWNEEQV